MKPLVIYHANCNDGLAAAAAVLFKYPDAECVEGSYNKSFDVACVEGREVYIVDFSFNRETMVAICKSAKKVILIDHHKSALDALQGLEDECINLDKVWCTTERSGAALAWLCMTSNVPQLVALIEDRDMWSFKLAGTAKVTAALRVVERTPEGFLELINQCDIPSLLRNGSILLKAYEIELDSILKTCTREIEIAGFKVLCANTSGYYASDVGNRLHAQRPHMFAATYFDTDDSRVFSLRSGDTAQDVSLIAAMYGGGGHRNAAGFRVPRNHELAKI